MSSVAQRCNRKTSEEKGVHQSWRFHSILLPFYDPKISPGWWDLKTWPLLIYYILLGLPSTFPGAVPWMEDGEGGGCSAGEGWWCVPEVRGDPGKTKPPCSTQVVVWPLPRTPCSGDMETERWQNAGPREVGVSTWTISAPALLCRENSLFYG